MFTFYINLNIYILNFYAGSISKLLTRIHLSYSKTKIKAS